jgi:hypothetical protein
LHQTIVRIPSEHKHRAVEALHQAAGDDAQHAAVPLLRVVDQRGGGFFDSNGLAFLADTRLHLLALGILIVQRLRQLLGAGGVRRENISTTARAVSMRPAAFRRARFEGHLARGHGRSVKPATSRSAQTGIANRVETREAVVDDGAVLSGERYDIGDSSDATSFGTIRQPPRFPPDHSSPCIRPCTA